VIEDGDTTTDNLWFWRGSLHAKNWIGTTAPGVKEAYKVKVKQLPTASRIAPYNQRISD
jgi:hypothetical protein